MPIKPNNTWIKVTWQISAIILIAGAALATVMGVFIEVPVMLMLAKICLKPPHWFKTEKYIDPTVARAEH
jgi:ACR3 family arsenite efflux pump ArsB